MEQHSSYQELALGGNPGITPNESDPFVEVLRQYVIDKKTKQLELQSKIKHKLRGDFVTDQNIAIVYIRAVLPVSPENLKFYSDISQQKTKIYSKGNSI